MWLVKALKQKPREILLRALPVHIFVVDIPLPWQVGLAETEGHLLIRAAFEILDDDFLNEYRGISNHLAGSTSPEEGINDFRICITRQVTILFGHKRQKLDS